MIVFVSGGARSGKSAVAEAAVRRAAGTQTPYYIATANVSDGEMAERIARHRRDRGEGWVTLEAPRALSPAVEQVPGSGAALIDCLTLWASQVLYPPPVDNAWHPTPEQALEDLGHAVDTARRRGVTLVIVSNDLNEALLPTDVPSAEIWRYVDFLQRAHRLVAGRADSVLEVIAGQSIEWKPARRAPHGSENAGSGDAHP